MVDWADLAGAHKKASNVVVLYVPSRDRDGRPIDQRTWVKETLEFLGYNLGGATAFPQGEGTWRDDKQGGKLLYDEPTMVQSYTDEASIQKSFEAFVAFLRRLGTETNQRAIGFMIDHEWYEIEFD